MKLITSNLIDKLITLSEDAVHICWITAFAMKSGVELVLPTLKKDHERCCEIQLLVGDYLCITQPKAFRLLIEHLPNAEIRMYQSNGRSFHPKAYLFRESNSQHVIVGSSNLSKSALTSGIEWSLHTLDNDTFDQSIDAFHKLFYSDNTIPANSESIRLYKDKYKDANKVTPLSYCPYLNHNPSLECAHLAEGILGARFAFHRILSTATVLV